MFVAITRMIGRRRRCRRCGLFAIGMPLWIVWLNVVSKSLRGNASVGTLLKKPSPRNCSAVVRWSG
jgi:hypothetical protein